MAVACGWWAPCLFVVGPLSAPRHHGLGDVKLPPVQNRCSKPHRREFCPRLLSNVRPPDSPCPLTPHSLSRAPLARTALPPAPWKGKCLIQSPAQRPRNPTATQRPELQPAGGPLGALDEAYDACRHKRSKSASVKNLLGRGGSSRNDVTDGSESIPPSSSATSLSSQQQQQQPSGSQPLSHPSLPGHHRSASTKHRPHLSASMSNVNAQDSSPTSPAYAPSPLSPTPKAASIEQSVKLFRVFESLRNGDTAAISKAIREQAAPADDQSAASVALPARTEGTTILHLAIQCAEAPVIEFVLSNATPGPDSVIDINGRDRDGNTPLHLAATLGRTPVVRMLLDQPGINDSITNYNGQTPLDLARTPDIFQQLQLARSIFIDTNVRKIQQLVAAGDMASLEKLLQDPRIKNTLDVNGGELATDPIVVEAGGTLLHEAAKKKDVKLAQLLLLNGADPFRRDRKGKLPQDYTKDDRTRAILKRSPAAAAAQRGIQEKTILAGAAAQPGAAPDSGMGAKESREMKGYLKKWTNYTSGYKLRWFVLEDGVLSYYKHQG